MRRPLAVPGSTADAPQAAQGRPPLAGFIRDDDAGWDDDALDRLLDALGGSGLPVDLAAIPTAVGDATARLIASRCTAGAAIGVHQHGFSHANHETAARKCEFGGARPENAQRQDLAAGRRLLQERFGERLDGFFTPPWNRCSTATPGLLARLGYTALSRDRGAPAQHDLPEIAVDVDWSRRYREGGAGRAMAACVDAIADCRRAGRPFGLMLHHAAMQPDEIDALVAILGLLAREHHLRWQPMRALLAVERLGNTAA